MKKLDQISDISLHTGTRTPLHVDKLSTIAFNLHAIGEGSKHWWFIHHEHRKEIEDKLTEFGGALHKDNLTKMRYMLGCLRCYILAGARTCH